MEQARMSSARISASPVFPKLVRSPHSTSTSASPEISVNSSRYGATLSSITWRSPSAAIFNVPSAVVAILLFEVSDGFRIAPLLDVDRIVAWAEDAAAAHLFLWGFHVELLAQAVEQLVHQPERHEVALAGIDEAEVEQGHQQHFPIELEMGEPPLP